MRMVFNFRMSVADYRHMMISRTFDNSRLRHLLLLASREISDRFYPLGRL